MRSRGVLAGLFAIVVLVLAFVYVVATAKGADGEGESTVPQPPVVTTVPKTVESRPTTTTAPTTTTVVTTTTVAPPPLVAPPPVAPVVSTGSVWDRLAQCEAGGNWAINTGNGYSGGLQWVPSTWTAYKAPGDPTMAWQATREQQIAAGERLLAASGGRFTAWPGFRAKLHLS